MTTQTQVKLGDVADLQWGDTSVTKKSYVTSGLRYPAFSASGPDGYLPYFDFDRTGVVLSAIGANAGKTWLASGRWSCIKNTIRFFSVDETVADTRYLFWSTKTHGTFPLRGSAQPFISQGDAREVVISLPPVEEQRAIAATLGALDDKIESNRRQVSSLNRTGRSLYEAAIAENSISVPISTLVEHRPGKHLPKANYRPGSITVYGSNSVMGLHDTPLYWGPFAVMARIGSYCGSLHWTDEPAWVNNNASALLPLSGAPSWILRHALEAIDMSQFRVGTGQPFIAVKALMATALQMPAEGLQGGLNQDLRSISRLGSQRLREIDALSALRDALIPELLSGRIRAADVEITQ